MSSSDQKRRSRAEGLQNKNREERWAAVKGWLDGRGGWGKKRGAMLKAVLDLVCSATKIKP